MKIKNYVETYFIISLLLISSILKAQIIETSNATGKRAVKPINVNYAKWSVGAAESFKAIKSLLIYDFSLQASRSVVIGQRLRFVAGYRTAGPNLEQNWGRVAMNMKTDIGSLLLGVGYEWFPFVTRGAYGQFLRSVKLVGGVSYLSKPEYVFEASLRDPYVWRNTTFSEEEVGTVSNTINTNKIQPYLGLGYDQFYLGKNINFSINGGILYQGKPQVSMVATNMLKPTEESAARLQYNLESYQFSPFFEILIQFNLK
jgi:hypothetical protein